MRNSALVLLFAVAVAAAPAAAQGHANHGAAPAAPAAQEGEHCALMMLGGAPLMTAMHAGPHAVLMQREALALTTEQVSRLDALKGEMHAGVHGHLTAARGVQEEAVALVTATPLELTAYEAKLREAAGHVVQAQTTAGRVMDATRQVLTPEQREAVAAWHGKMGGMDHGAMQHGAADGGHQGMQHGAGGMQHGAAAGGMQHGAEGGMMNMMQMCMSMHGGAAHGGH